MENKCGFSRISNRFKPPYWLMFNADCGIHDDNYDKGGTRDDRLNADLGFLRRMLKDCNQEPDYNRKRRAVRMAITYYFMVRIFGPNAFNYKK